MIKILLISALLLSGGMGLLLVKVLSRREGRFSSQHIHDSQAMRSRGIHCVLDQDRQARTSRSTQVAERCSL